MKFSSTLLSLISVCLLLAGCETTTSGDLKSSGSGQFRNASLPEFSIGSKGTHEFVVRGLNERTYPFKIRIYSRKSEASLIPRLPFEESRFRVEILDYSTRRVLASRHVRPNTFRVEGYGKYDQIFYGRKEPSLPFLENYYVRVTVLEPSERSGDGARIFLR